MTETLTPVKPSEALDRAASIIEAHGWAQDAYIEPIFNDGGPGGLPPSECPVCPRGAIAAAAGRHPEFVSDWPTHCDLLGEDLPSLDERDFSDADQAALKVIVDAEEAFARYLRGLGFATGLPLDDQELIEVWNDEPHRTEAEVIAALRACAVGEREAGR